MVAPFGKFLGRPNKFILFPVRKQWLLLQAVIIQHLTIPLELTSNLSKKDKREYLGGFAGQNGGET